MIVVELENGKKYGGYRISFFDGWVKLFVPHAYNQMSKRWEKMSESWVALPKNRVKVVSRNEERV